MSKIYCSQCKVNNDVFIPYQYIINNKSLLKNQKEEFKNKVLCKNCINKKTEKKLIFINPGLPFLDDHYHTAPSPPPMCIFCSRYDAYFEEEGFIDENINGKYIDDLGIECCGNCCKKYIYAKYNKEIDDLNNETIDYYYQYDDEVKHFFSDNITLCSFESLMNDYAKKNNFNKYYFDNNQTNVK